MDTTKAAGLVAGLDSMIGERSLLTHPFYTKWTDGTLTLDALRGYAAQYYAFESSLPRVLSALLARTTEPSHRQALLDNLWDEEHGDENHAELWLRFAESLGVDRSDVRDAAPNEQTTALVSFYDTVAWQQPVAAGVAALYAYESQVPAVATAKLRGLPAYGVDRSAFFEVHAGMDVEHAEAERRIIAAADPGERDAVVAATSQALAAWWTFLDGVDVEPA